MRRDAEFGKERRQIGVILFVIDDEAGIDRNLNPVVIGVDRRRMASGPCLAFIKRDVVHLTQRPGCGGARDAGADDGDLQPAGSWTEVRVHAASLVAL